MYISVEIFPFEAKILQIQILSTGLYLTNGNKILLALKAMKNKPNQKLIVKSQYCLINIIKQDIHIHVVYSRDNEIFCGHSWVAGGCFEIYFFKHLFFKIFNGQRRAL